MAFLCPPLGQVSLTNVSSLSGWLIYLFFSRLLPPFFLPAAGSCCLTRPLLPLSPLVRLRKHPYLQVALVVVVVLGGMALVVGKVEGVESIG